MQMTDVDIKSLYKIMKKLDSSITEYADTADYDLIEPLTELQEKIQETMEIIRVEIKESKGLEGGPEEIAPA